MKKISDTPFQQSLFLHSAKIKIDTHCDVFVRALRCVIDFDEQIVLYTVSTYCECECQDHKLQSVIISNFLCPFSLDQERDTTNPAVHFSGIRVPCPVTGLASVAVAARLASFRECLLELTGNCVARSAK